MANPITLFSAFKCHLFDRLRTKNRQNRTHVYFQLERNDRPILAKHFTRSANDSSKEAKKINGFEKIQKSCLIKEKGIYCFNFI